MLGLACRKVCQGGIPCSGCMAGADVRSWEGLRSVQETLSKTVRQELSIRVDNMSHWMSGSHCDAHTAARLTNE